MKNADIVQYGTYFLRGFCISLPFMCVDFLAVGVFQATGMGREAFAFCGIAQDRAGDTAAVLVECAIPAVWFDLCAAGCRDNTVNCGSDRVGEAVQAA